MNDFTYVTANDHDQATRNYLQAALLGVSAGTVTKVEVFPDTSHWKVFPQRTTRITVTRLLNEGTDDEEYVGEQYQMLTSTFVGLLAEETCQ